MRVAQVLENRSTDATRPSNMSTVYKTPINSRHVSPQRSSTLAVNW